MNKLTDDERVKKLNYSLNDNSSNFKLVDDKLICKTNEKYSMNIKQVKYNVYFTNMKLLNDKYFDNIILNLILEKKYDMCYDYIESKEEFEKLTDEATEINIDDIVKNTTLYLIKCNEKKYLYNMSSLMKLDNDNIKNDFEFEFFDYCKKCKLSLNSLFDKSIILNKFMYCVNKYEDTNINIFELSNYKTKETSNILKNVLNINSYEELIHNIYNVELNENILSNLHIKNKVKYLCNVFTKTKNNKNFILYYKLNDFIDNFKIIK